MNKKFKSNSGEILMFRELLENDKSELGIFFENLSEETRSRFGPHPLTKEQADLLCENIDKDNIKRFVISDELQIVGYFIINFNLFEHERNRYAEFNITLDPQKDPVFAPCIADKYQNQGVASATMQFIIDYAKANCLRSLVLMGGTQETNAIARRFYTKFNFKEYAQFFTAHNNSNNIDMKLDL